MRGEFYHPQESVCARARSRFAPGAPWLEDPNWRVRTWSLPLLWSRAPPPVITTPPRLAFSGGGSGAAGCRPTRVTGVGGGVGVHLPQASWYCSPTLSAPPIWPPRLTVVRPNAAHGRSRKGSEREPGDERGAARAGRAHHSSRPTLTPPTPRGEDPR